MDAFRTYTGVGVPLPVSNIDTDQIIPAVYCKRVARTGFDDALFAHWRTDPDFILNQQPYDRGSVLVAGPNFGTGSSREHAVWALRDYGFKAVISSRFADIFRGNAGKQGMVTAMIDQDQVDALWSALQEDPGLEVTVDLEGLTVSYGEVTIPFTIDPHSRHMLLNGLDDIESTLSNAAQIAEFENRRPAWMPRTALI